MMRYPARTVVWLLGLIVALPGLVSAAPATATDQERLQALRQREQQLTEQIQTAEDLLAGELPAEQRRTVESQLERWRNTLKDVQGQLAAAGGGAAAPAEDNGRDEETNDRIRQIRRRIGAVLGRMQDRAKELQRLREVLTTPPAEQGRGEDTGTDPATDPATAGARYQQLSADQATDFMELQRLQTELKELEGPRQPTDAFDAENMPELNPLMLYAGDLASNTFGAELGNWGSGLIEEKEYGVAEGLKSLLLYADGYYRGGRLDFATPPDISLYFQKPQISYLQMDVYFFPDNTATTTGGMSESGERGMPPVGGTSAGMEGGLFPGMQPGSGMMPPGGTSAGMEGGLFPGMQPGSGMMPPGGTSAGGEMGGRAGGPPIAGGGMPGMPGMMPPGMPGMPGMMPPGMPGMPGIANEGSMGPGMGELTVPGGPGMPGMAGEGSMMPGMPGMGGTVSLAPKTRSLRVVLDTDRGPVVAEDFYFDWQYYVHPGWTRVFIPIKDMINVSERVPTQLKRLVLFGDTTDEFYIGMIRMVADEVPLEPEIVGAEVQQAIAGSEFQLQCMLEGGLSILKYVWDWGDGEIEETDEPLATHLYVKPGEYTVTLTVKDTDGLKEDGRATVKLVVKPFSEMPAQPMAPGMMPGQQPPGVFPGAPILNE